MAAGGTLDGNLTPLEAFQRWVSPAEPDARDANTYIAKLKAKGLSTDAINRNVYWKFGAVRVPDFKPGPGKPVFRPLLRVNW